MLLIPLEQVPCIYFFRHVVQNRIEAIGEDDVALGLELAHVVDHDAVEEGGAVFERGLVDDHGDALGLDALHHALNGRRTEVVGVALHREAIDAHSLGVTFDDAVGNEVLADGVALHHGLNQGLGDVLVVGEQLLGVLGQAVVAVAEARVVVVAADARIHAHALDDLLRVQALGLRVGVQFVEVTHAHGEVGVREEFDGLGLGGVGNQDLHILVLGALGKQLREHLRFLLLVLVGTHHDAAGVQVVIQRLALTEELRREDDVVDAVFLPDAVGVTHRHGALDDHQHLRVHAQHMLDRILHGAGVEEMMLIVVVGRRGDDDQFGRRIGGVLVHGRGQVELALAFADLPEEALDLIVLDGADELVEFVRLGRRRGNRCNVVVLGKEYGEAQTHIADSGDGDVHVKTGL